MFRNLLKNVLGEGAQTDTAVLLISQHMQSVRISRNGDTAFAAKAGALMKYYYSIHTSEVFHWFHLLLVLKISST